VLYRPLVPTASSPGRGRPRRPPVEPGPGAPQSSSSSSSSLPFPPTHLRPLKVLSFLHQPRHPPPPPISAPPPPSPGTLLPGLARPRPRQPARRWRRPAARLLPGGHR
jgi:hypothetical protein